MHSADRLEITIDSHDEALHTRNGKFAYPNADLEETIASALSHGCRKLDLFFMVGIPGQRPEDAMAAVGHCDHLAACFGNNRRPQFCVAPLAPFLDPASRAFEGPPLVSKKRALVNSRTIPHVDDAEAWSAACFRVRPGLRRRGLMHDLLDGAIEHARASGAVVIEGYPVDPEGDRIDQGAAYVGTVGLFEAHGFERVLQTAGRSAGKRRWLVRRRLG